MSPPPDLRGAAPPREALLMHTLCFNPGCSPRKSTGLRELGGGGAQMGGWIALRSWAAKGNGPGGWGGEQTPGAGALRLGAAGLNPP